MRGVSAMEFVEVARKLELHAFQVCTKAPKRYERFLTGRIFELASTVHEEVRAANNNIPRNQHEAQMRRDHLIKANDALQNLSPKLVLLYDSILQNPEKCDWIDNAMKVFGEYITEEAKLIAATKKADYERYKDLPDLGGEYDLKLRHFTELFIKMCKKVFGLSIEEKLDSVESDC
jgi:hypothetical protein